MEFPKWVICCTLKESFLKLITKNDIVAKVLDYLGEKSGGLNFKPDYKSFCILRKGTESVLIYNLLFYDRTNVRTNMKGVQIEPYIWINIKPVEKIYKELTLNKYLKKDTDFITVGNSVADLMANPGGIYKKRNNTLNLFVFDDKDVEIVSKELLKHFQDIALDYFNKYNSIKAVDESLNSYPSEYCVHMSNDTYRFMKGLIAAKLENNPNYEDLLQTYSDLMTMRAMPQNSFEELSNLKKKFS